MIKKIINIIYGIGASIIIIGVIGKLSETYWGEYVLYIGLIIEAIIFFISAFDFDNKTEKKYDKTENIEKILKYIIQINNNYKYIYKNQYKINKNIKTEIKKIKNYLISINKKNNNL